MSGTPSDTPPLAATGTAESATAPDHPLRVFIVTGEHSGDALGAKLVAALRSQSSRPLVLGGVGGEAMDAEGLTSLYPLADVAVMGPLNILAKLPRIVRRVYQTVHAALAFDPDILVPRAEDNRLVALDVVAEGMHVDPPVQIDVRNDLSHPLLGLDHLLLLVGSRVGAATSHVELSRRTADS